MPCATEGGLGHLTPRCICEDETFSNRSSCRRAHSSTGPARAPLGRAHAARGCTERPAPAGRSHEHTVAPQPRPAPCRHSDLSLGLDGFMAEVMNQAEELDVCVSIMAALARLGNTTVATACHWKLDEVIAGGAGPAGPVAGVGAAAWHILEPCSRPRPPPPPPGPQPLAFS